MRWGIENLNIDEKRLKELGAVGMMPPIKVSCMDHEGSGLVKFQQWDGAKWKVITDWMEPDRKLVRQKVEDDGQAVREGEEHRAAGLRQRELIQFDQRTDGGRDPPFGFLGQPMSAVPQARAEPILSVANIEVIYDHVILVLRGVSLDVQEGQIVALLGANGAGKTTTLKAISNLLRAERGDVTKGKIVYRGERIDQLTSVGAGEARHLPGDGGPALLPAPHRGGKSSHRAPTPGVQHGRCAAPG